MVFAVLSKKYCTATISWTHRRTDRASKQEPCPLGTRPAPSALVCFAFFIFFSFFSVYFPFFLLRAFFFPFFFRVYQCIQCNYVFLVGIIWLQVIWDGISQLATVSFLLRTTGSTSVHLLRRYILVCIFSHQKCFSLFCDHGPDSGKLS